MITMNNHDIEFGVAPPRKSSSHDKKIADLAGKAKAGEWNIVHLGSEQAINSFRVYLHKAHPGVFATRRHGDSDEVLYVKKRT